MTPARNRRAALLAAAAAAMAALAPHSGASSRTHSDIGVVLLHGLGGSSMSMSTLAYELREKGHLVTAPDMTWSAMRSHDVTVDRAEQEIRSEIELLRQKGARRIVLAGFSKGGLFAAYLAGRMNVDALVAIAPNGITRAGDVEQARKLVAQGKGAEKAELALYDPVTGRSFPSFTPPTAFLSWFDPQGPIYLDRVFDRVRPGTPVLLVVPTRDFENLRQAKAELFASLPPHRSNALYEPDSNHIGAVNASAAEVVRWLGAALPAQKRRSQK